MGFKINERKIKYLVKMDIYIYIYIKSINEIILIRSRRRRNDTFVYVGSRVSETNDTIK